MLVNTAVLCYHLMAQLGTHHANIFDPRLTRTYWRNYANR